MSRHYQCMLMQEKQQQLSPAYTCTVKITLTIYRILFVSEFLQFLQHKMEMFKWQRNRTKMRKTQHCVGKDWTRSLLLLLR